MRFLIEPVYCMTWICTLDRAHYISKSPIKEDNILASMSCALSLLFVPHKIEPWEQTNNITVMTYPW